MAKKMPVGTIRSWESGEVIKAHDGSIYHNGWISLSTSNTLDAIGKSCDMLANSMLHEKLPINGEAFLDHEIGEFEKRPGQEFGKYTPDDFKKYEGYAGAGRYAFRNEFSRRYMKPKLDVAEEINNRLLAANEKKGQELGKNADQIYSDNFLTQEEKDDIRAKVRAEYRADDSYFTPKEAEELAAIVKRTKKQLDAGLNFEGEQKKVYDEATAVGASLPGEYQRLGVKRKQRDAAMDAVNQAFADNWGVRESFKLYIEEQYSAYIKKYRDQIRQDEAKEQESVFGVALDEDPTTFYPKLYAKLQTVRDPNKFLFNELISLRFEVKYDKQLSGQWDYKMLPAVEQIEQLMMNLPPGHFLTNTALKQVTQENYNGGDSGGYAWYSPMGRRINLSKEVVTGSNGIWSRLSHLNEFQSTMTHEVGHAVSQKFGREHNIKYKEFVVACGWSYQQEELRRGMTATGSQKDLPREGSMSHLKLLTDYAQKSPEEAFAEHYSIYHNNREQIDHWLNTGDSSSLNRASKTVCDRNFGPTTFSSALPRQADTIPDHELSRLVDNLHLEPTEHIHPELISPWEAEIGEHARKSYDPTNIKGRLRSSNNQITPVVSVNDHSRYTIVDGANSHAHAKYAKKMLPSLSISREFYTALSSRGYSDEAITNYAVHTMGFEQVPSQASIPRVMKGLDYRNKILPVEEIMKCEQIFRKMRAVYNSEELQKAVQEILLG